MKTRSFPSKQTKCHRWDSDRSAVDHASFDSRLLLLGRAHVRRAVLTVAIRSQLRGVHRKNNATPPPHCPPPLLVQILDIRTSGEPLGEAFKGPEFSRAGPDHQRSAAGGLVTWATLRSSGFVWRDVFIKAGPISPSLNQQHTFHGRVLPGATNRCIIYNSRSARLRSESVSSRQRRAALASPPPILFLFRCAAADLTR